MRLVTHCLLKCNAKGLEPGQGYPLRIEADRVEEIESPFNAELVKNVITKVNLVTVKGAALELKVGKLIHETEDFSWEAIENNEALLRELHHVLFEVHFQDGTLVCPHSGRRFPVKDGIANMLLHEDEV